MSEIRKYIARFGAMRLLGIFSFASDAPLFHGTRVILRTSRGQEAGTVLCEATPESVSVIPPGMEENRIVRIMTAADETESRQIRTVERDEFSRAKEIIDRMKIVMDLVRVEHLFGGERLIIYYVAEGRIDFRELVKILASEFQTRIEMRQIGVRDETKLLADIGDCGREVCCNSYLIAMPPVSMKMAKLQKATLDPTKISGRCGRLKCCLRYEYDVYAELLTLLPPVGKWVETPDGTGRVIAQELLAKKVLVELGDRTRKYFGADEISVLTLEREPAEKRPESRPPRRSEQGETDENGDELEKGGRSERPERSERSERSERPERQERTDRPERRSERNSRSDSRPRFDRRGGTEKNRRSDRRGSSERESPQTPDGSE